MNNTCRIVLGALVGGLVLVGCDKKESATKDSNPLDAVKTAVGDAAKKAKDEVGKKVEEGFASLRDGAASAAQDTLDQAKAKIGVLKEKAASASAEVKPAMESAVTKIEEQFAKVQAKLPELKTATAETWKSISESVAREGSSLMEMIKGAMEKYGVK